MSIEHICGEAERRQLLARFVPSYGTAKRRLFLTKEAANDLSSRGTIAAMKLRPAVKARFEEWVSGGRVLSEGNEKPGYLKRLDAPPHEVWEFRITAPSSKVRAIGRFMTPNAYVVTGVYTRNFLGKYGSKAWLQVQQQCVERWKEVFGSFQPFAGNIYADYVTENCDAFRLGRILSERERELRGRTGKKRSASRR